MKERIEKSLIEVSLIIILILLIGVLIKNKTSINDISLMSIGDTSTRGSKLTNKDNNITSFDVGYLKPYVHILLSSSKSENIEEGLKFDIINPNGEIIDSGILYDGKRFTEVYKGVPGEWRIILHFEGNNASSMIDYGYSITSKREETWK